MNVVVSMQKRTRMLVAREDGRGLPEMFPSMVLGVEGVVAKGSYAEAQFLSPDELKIKELVNVLKEKKIGVVAHFYMDPEVQGVLTAEQKHWPHINISDSLVMADRAVRLAEAGCQYITVLGVDFMSENVLEILDQAGFDKVGVYGMSNEQIGCSLADAAASPAYIHFLETASKSSPSLHVIYINTSLETKAHGHELVPTITCTSNVVPTILQATGKLSDKLVEQIVSQSSDAAAVSWYSSSCNTVTVINCQSYYRDMQVRKRASHFWAQFFGVLGWSEWNLKLL